MTGLRPCAHPLGFLARGEARVLAFTAAGFDTAETAELLGLGFQTVKTQRAAVRRKLKARNIAHAVALGFSQGFVTAEVIDRCHEYHRQSVALKQAAGTD